MNTTAAPLPVLAGLLGAGVGLGLLLLIAGQRGPIHSGTSRTRRWQGPGHGRFAWSAGIGLVAWMSTGWFVAGVLAAGTATMLPTLLGRDRRHARRVARVEAIAAWTEMLRDTLSAAAGLEQAILATAPLAPTAIRAEITALATRVRGGQRLAPALRQLADDLADPTGDLVIAALVLAADQQARHLGDLLGSLAHAAREQAFMRLRVETGRARTRTSVRVIVGTTVVFAVGMVVFNRAYLSPFDTVTGQVVLLGIGALFASGFAWLTRIAQVPEPPRFLGIAVSEAVPEGQVSAS